MRHLSIIFIVLTLFVLSCQKDSSEDFILRYGYEYFPDEEGNYVIYNVDSITYNDFFNPVLVTRKSFQLKEVIGESFTDLSGRPSKKLYRYTRENASSTWNIADVYYQTLNKNTQMAQDAIRNLMRSLSSERNCNCGQALATALITNPKIIPAETRSKLDLLVSKYLT